MEYEYRSMIDCAHCPFDDQAECAKTFGIENPTNTHKIFFGKNAILFSEFEKLKGIYCIRNGICKVSKMSAEGRDQIIEILVKGTLLGFRSILNNESTFLRAEAVSDLEVCFVPKEIFLKTLKNKPKFAFELLQIISNYIKQTDEKIFDMGQKNLEQRAAKLVLSMQDFFELDEQSYINVPLRREDMANFIGVATESFIRKLGEFQKKGWIKTKGKKIKILNRQRLVQLYSG